MAAPASAEIYLPDASSPVGSGYMRVWYKDPNTGALTPTARVINPDAYARIVNREVARGILNGATGQTPSSLSSAVGTESDAAQTSRTALATATDSTAVGRVAGEASSAASAMKTLPKFSEMLGTVPLVGTTAYIGVLIGSGISAKFLNPEPSPPSIPTAVSIQGVDESMLCSSWLPASGAEASCPTDSPAATGHIFAADGFVTVYQTVAQTPFVGTTGTCLTNYPRPGILTGFSWINGLPFSNPNSACSGMANFAMAYRPTRAKVEDYHGQTVTKTSSAPSNVTYSTTYNTADNGVLRNPDYSEYNQFNSLNDGVNDGDGELGQMVMPDCRGLSASACQTAIASAGSSSTVSVTTLSNSAADLTRGAGQVVSSSPSPGATTSVTASVTVNVNPTPLPVVIPAPGTRETYDAYSQRLTTAGITTTPTRVNLTDAGIDPARGPAEVVSTSPVSGTQVSPSTSIQVRTNPDSAPDPPSQPFFPPISIPALALPSIPTPCTIFPFGVPCYIKNLVDQWAGTPVTPSISFHFPYGGDGNNTTISMAMFDPYMGAIRTVTGIGIMAALTWFFFGMAFGGVAGKGGDNE